LVAITGILVAVAIAYFQSALWPPLASTLGFAD
jgi:hypothetical protein